MPISEELLKQAREESETGNEQYSRGFISDVITELLAARKALQAAITITPEDVGRCMMAMSEVHSGSASEADRIVRAVLNEFVKGKM